jgi:hypothetical protein
MTKLELMFSCQYYLTGDWQMQGLAVEKMQAILIHGQNLQETLQQVQMLLLLRRLEMSATYPRLALNLKDDDHELAAAAI